MLMYGGEVDTNTRLGDLWEWSGVNWSLVSAVNPPGVRSDVIAVFDEARSKAFYWGGLYQDTWVYDAQGWSVADRPLSAFLFDATFDERSGAPLAIAAVGAPGLGTIGLRNGRWAQLPVPLLQVQNASPSLVYHEALRRVVMLGVGSQANETWLWDGSGWAQATHLGGPVPARRRSGVAYDRARGRVVLFGGSAPNDLAETWELETILFGGGGTTFQQLSETWEWDGVNWSQLSPPVSPPGRGGAFLIYVPALGGLVLCGREPLSDFNSWLWDGTNWTRLPAPLAVRGTPGNPFAICALYDPRFKEILAIHQSVVAPPNTIWRLHFDDLASTNPCPRLGENIDLTVDLPSERNHLCLFALSGGKESGITLYRDPVSGSEILPLEADRLLQISLGMWLNTTLDGRGTGRILLPVPNDPSLLWLRMYAAAATVDLARLRMRKTTSPVEILVTR
jgi:hypothetical protein